MTSRRIQRVNQLLREEISELLRREVRDDTITSSLISITEVDTSPDLRNAKVFFSVYGDDEQVKEARKHLERASNFLRRELMDRIDLRVTPRLEFVFDDSLAKGARIMSLMRDIERDKPPTDSDPA